MAWFHIFFVLSVDTLNFLLKYVLWIEAESDLCKARVAIWAFSAIAITKEFYRWTENPDSGPGPFTNLAIFTLTIEYSIWFKYYLTDETLLSIAAPLHSKIIIGSYISVVLIGFIVASYGKSKKE